MNYKYIRNNNSEIILSKNFVYKKFLDGCYDNKTIKNFCLLDKKFNHKPVIIDILKEENTPFALISKKKELIKKIIKMKRFPEKSNCFYLLEKNKITSLNMLDIAKRLYLFHLKSGGFATNRGHSLNYVNDFNIFLERAKKDKMFYNKVKKQLKVVQKGFEQSRLPYKTIRTHGDFLLSNIYLLKNKYYYTDFGHLERHSKDLFLKDISSLYIDLILNEKDELAQFFLLEYLKILDDKEIFPLIKVFNLKNLFFRYLICDGFYNKEDKNKLLLKGIQNNIYKILYEENQRKN